MAGDGNGQMLVQLTHTTLALGCQIFVEVIVEHQFLLQEDHQPLSAPLHGVVLLLEDGRHYL